MYILYHIYIWLFEIACTAKALLKQYNVDKSELQMEMRHKAVANMTMKIQHVGKMEWMASLLHRTSSFANTVIVTKHL